MLVTARTYQVICTQCGQHKEPYRSTPPPDPYVCAWCLVPTRRPGGARRPRKPIGKVRIAGRRRKAPQRGAPARTAAPGETT